MSKSKVLLSIITIGFTAIVHAGGDIVQEEVYESTPTVVQSESTTNSWYAGIGLGGFKLDNSTDDESYKKATATILAGYEISKYLSIEGRYTASLGDVKFKDPKGTQKTDSSFSNIALYTKLSYPIGEFKPYLLLGYGKSKITNIADSDRSESGFQYGAGASYELDNHWCIFADYTRLYDDKGFDGRASDSNIKIDTAIAGIKYRF